MPQPLKHICSCSLSHPLHRSGYDRFKILLDSQIEEVKQEAVNVLLYLLPLVDRTAIAHKPEQFVRDCRFSGSIEHEVQML